MRGFTEMQEWMEKCSDSDRDFSAAEVDAAMADELASQIDAARDRAKDALI